MKKLFLAFISCLCLNGCAFGPHYDSLDVSFIKPTIWGKKKIPASQSCRRDAGKGFTPALFVSNIPSETNLIILQINNESVPFLRNGAYGQIGFYHNGESTAELLPVKGETFDLPKYAFMEKASYVYPARPFPYLPPCGEKNNLYTATIKAVKRTGSFDEQKTELLGVGKITLGLY